MKVSSAGRSSSPQAREARTASPSCAFRVQCHSLREHPSVICGNTSSASSYPGFGCHTLARFGLHSSDSGTGQRIRSCSRFRNTDGCSEPESEPESEHGGYYHIRGTSGRSLLCFPCACGMSDADIPTVRDVRSLVGFFGHFLSRFLPRGSSHQEGEGPGHTNVLECPRGSCEVIQARCMR